jgi:asparagine synthase (glutamine-hydrolysing)
MRALPLRRLEAAAGYVFGQDGGELELPPGHRDPRAALTAAMRPALQRGRCHVSFSGGRDSSAVLAVATDIARREGLDDPIPVTLRFSAVPSTDESDWQETVIDRLGIVAWEVVEIADELDLLGAIARQTLTEHGLLWPPNAYAHVPLLRRAHGGALMTGFDGDGVFGFWRWRHAQAVLHRRTALSRRDPARVMLALLPPSARRHLMRSPYERAAPWLSAAGSRQLARAARAFAAAEPRRWDRRLG